MNANEKGFLENISVTTFQLEKLINIIIMNTYLV